MILKSINIFLVLGLLGAMSWHSYPQNKQPPQRETGQTRGFDLVFVVDVSPGKEKDGKNKYLSMVEQYVASVYDMFQNSFEINANAKNDYYLVTFAEKAAVFESDKIDKQSIMQEIRKQIGSNASKKSNPDQGLIKVLDPFDDSFPKKVGIVFLIYHSDTVENKEYLRPTVNLLRKSGFTTFIITLSELYRLKNTDIEALVKNYFAEALNIDFNSPVERKDYNKEKIEWEKESEQKFKEKKNGQSKPQFENEKKGEISSKHSNEEELITNNNQSHTGTGILSFIFLFFLFVIIIVIASFVFYFKLWREKYKFFKAIFLKKEKKKEGTGFVVNIPIVDKKEEEGWFPDYPEECRCKNYIDIRQIVATESIDEVLDRKKASIIKWLDLCCGNGNTLVQIEDSIGEDSSRVEYYGYDLDRRSIDECRRIIHSKTLSERLADVEVDVVNLYNSPIPGKNDFDIITLLNVLHEIDPFKIFDLIKNALDKCKQNGVILIVDMCSLPHLEWKAITWQIENLKDLVSYFMRDYRITCQRQSINIRKYSRKVDVFRLKLFKKNVNKNLLDNWNTKKEIRNRRDIIYRCLEKKKKMLSEQLINIHYEIKNKKNNQEEWKTKVRHILWDYWSTCEVLSIPRK